MIEGAAQGGEPHHMSQHQHHHLHRTHVSELTSLNRHDPDEMMTPIVTSARTPGCIGRNARELKLKDRIAPPTVGNTDYISRSLGSWGKLPAGRRLNPSFSERPMHSSRPREKDWCCSPAYLTFHVTVIHLSLSILIVSRYNQTGSK